MSQPAASLTPHKQRGPSEDVAHRNMNCETVKMWESAHSMGFWKKHGMGESFMRLHIHDAKDEIKKLAVAAKEGDVQTGNEFHDTNMRDEGEAIPRHRDPSAQTALLDISSTCSLFWLGVW